MGNYCTIRRYDTNCHIYEFNPEVERLGISVGNRLKLTKLSSFGICDEDAINEHIVAKLNGGFFDALVENKFDIESFLDDALFFSNSFSEYPILLYWKDTKRLEVKTKITKKFCKEHSDEIGFAVGVPYSLVINGEIDFGFSKDKLKNIYKEDPFQRAPRSMIGQKSNGNIVFVAVEGRSSDSIGFTINHSAYFMQNDLGCITAVMVEGGDKTELMVNNSIKNKLSAGEEVPTSSAFATYSTTGTEKIEYSGIGYIINLAKGQLLDLHKYPSSDSKVLYKIPLGTQINITSIDIQGHWYEISVSEGCATYRGWIPRRYVEDKIITIKNDNTQYISFNRGISANTNFRVLFEAYGYYKIIYNGEEVWIAAKDIK